MKGEGWAFAVLGALLAASSSFVIYLITPLVKAIRKDDDDE